MRWFLRSVFSCAALCAAFGLAIKPSRADQRSEEPRQSRAKIVEDALRREANGRVDDRIDLLRPAMTQAKGADLAWWQSGFVFDAKHKQWLTAAEASEAAAHDARLKAYDKLRHARADTIDGQLEVARWCLAQKLTDQAQAHLARVLELDPNQAEARRLLGYRLEGGSWVGDLETADSRAKARKAANDLSKWKPRLEKLRAMIQSGSKSQKAQRMAALRAIRDPAAAGAIDEVFCARGGDDMLLGISLLENLQSAESSAILARYAVFAPWKTVGKRAAEALRSQRKQDFVPLLLAGMEGRDYQRAEFYQGLGVERAYYRQLFFAGDQPSTANSATKPALSPAAPTMPRANLRPFQQPRTSIAGIMGPQPAQVSAPGTTAPVAMSGAANDFAAGSGTVASSSASLDDAGFRTLMRAAEREQSSSAANSSSNTLTRRLCAVLSEATGETKFTTGEQWWNWWYVENDCLPPTREYRPVAYVPTLSSQWNLSPPTQPEYGDSALSPLPPPPPYRCECFAAGTVVWTETGPVAVEKVRMGDRVFACDPETGCLALKVVLRPTVRPPTQLYAIRLDAEEIRSTGGHCFWVSGRGWVMARDLEPGMNVHTIRGTATVAGIKKDKTEAAYNLVVEGFHSYFVGKGKYLTHDNTIRRPTDRLVPGLAASK